MYAGGWFGMGKDETSWVFLNDYANFNDVLRSDATNGITVSDSTLSSDIWAVDSNINGGLPHLKNFYWQDS